MEMLQQAPDWDPVSTICCTIDTKKKSLVHTFGQFRKSVAVVMLPVMSNPNMIVKPFILNRLLENVSLLECISRVDFKDVCRGLKIPRQLLKWSIVYFFQGKSSCSSIVKKMWGGTGNSLFKSHLSHAFTTSHFRLATILQSQGQTMSCGKLSSEIQGKRFKKKKKHGGDMIGLATTEKPKS